MPTTGPRASRAVYGEPGTWAFCPVQPLAWDRRGPSALLAHGALLGVAGDSSLCSAVQDPASPLCAVCEPVWTPDQFT